MKKLFIGLSVMLMSLLIVTSCSKNDGLTPEVASKDEVTNQEVPASQEIEADENIIYLIDNEVVDESSFQWNVEGMTYHINIGEKDNLESENVYYMAFSNPNDYDNFMRSEIGSKYDVHQAIIAHLRDYAQTSGAVDYLEQHGTVPQFYLDYEQRYLAENLPPEVVNARNQRTITGVLFKWKRCRRPFNMSIPLLGTPFFIFNDDEASSFEGLFIGGYHTSFNFAFYQQQLFGLTVWGFSCTNMPTAVDNLTSSWWSIGI
jgi:hypothetical protein